MKKVRSAFLTPNTKAIESPLKYFRPHSSRVPRKHCHVNTLYYV